MAIVERADPVLRNRETMSWRLGTFATCWAPVRTVRRYRRRGPDATGLDQYYRE
jgi:hypothetical protein